MAKKTSIKSQYEIIGKDTGELITEFTISISDNKYRLFDGAYNEIKCLSVRFAQSELEKYIIDYAISHNANVIKKSLKIEETEKVYDFNVFRFVDVSEN